MNVSWKETEVGHVVFDPGPGPGLGPGLGGVPASQALCQWQRPCYLIG